MFNFFNLIFLTFSVFYAVSIIFLFLTVVRISLIACDTQVFTECLASEAPFISRLLYHQSTYIARNIIVITYNIHNIR